MKRIIVLILLILLSSSCAVTGNTAREEVENYFKSYQMLSKEVTNDIEVIVENENINDEQKRIYVSIFEKQYRDLKYEIINEYYDGDNAIVTAKIEVYDLYQAQKNALDYLKSDITKFYDENNQYNNDLYTTYKLELMNSTNERITYRIELNVIKENDIWVLNEITSSNLEKIHGIYNYDDVNQY